MARLCLVLCLIGAALSQDLGGHKAALSSALNTIEDRIKATDAQDSKTALEIQNNCSTSLTHITGRIGEQNETVIKNNASVIKTEGDIEANDNALDANRLAWDKKNASYTAKIKQIAEGKETRAKQHNQYLEYSSDTTVAINAVVEVIGLVGGSTLGSNEAVTKNDFDENAELRKTDMDFDSETGAYARSGKTVEDPDFSPTMLAEKTSTLLRKLSRRVGDPNVQSFVEMAALSASTVSGDGDVSKLNELLNSLLGELNTYNTTLLNQEEKQLADWIALNATYHEEKAQIEGELATLKSEEAALITKGNELRVKLGKEQTVLENNIKLLNDYLVQRTELQEMCTAHANAFTERSKRRAQELATLDKIRDVVNKKFNMTGSADGHLGYTAEPGYIWQLQSWSEVPCVDRLQTRVPHCINQKEGKPTEEEYKCGTRPDNLVRPCSKSVGLKGTLGEDYTNN